MARVNVVRDIDIGYAEMMDNFRDLGGGVDTYIGMHRADFSPEDVMRKGMFSEYGARFTVNTKMGESYQLTIPPRPTHRFAFLGQFHALKVRRAIRKLKNPPNAPYTIAKKREKGINPPDDPLIETGDMMRGIDWSTHRERKSKRF